MQIHLVRSSEVDKELFDNVLEILDKYNGPLKFIAGNSEVNFSDNQIHPEKFKKDKFRRQENFSIIMDKKISSYAMLKNWPPEYPEVVNVISWKSIFEKCNDYRRTNHIINDDNIFLLTGNANDKNWFSSWDPSGLKNSFVHAGQWEYYLPCDPRFPIAYEVIVTVLQGLLFKDFDEAMMHVHKKPRGCVNDFCQDKKEVTLKLRTADICTDCQELLFKKNIYPRITDQVLRTLDDIRTQMLFRERFKSTRQPSRLEIKGPQKRIFFTDLGDVELKLTPLERTVYLLFLEHPAGLRLPELSNYKSRIENTYKEIGNSRTVAEFHNSIDQLIDPTENSLSEKISRIKSKIISLTGEDMAVHYIIEGARDERKMIRLDRKLVSINNDWRESNQ